MCVWCVYACVCVCQSVSYAEFVRKLFYGHNINFSEQNFCNIIIQNFELKFLINFKNSATENENGLRRYAVSRKEEVGEREGNVI